MLSGDTFSLAELIVSYERKKLLHTIKSSSSSFQIFKELFPLETLNFHESFFVLFLNNRNQVICYKKISDGGITGTVVDVRIIFALALKVLATGIVMAHNHPSGNLKPSAPDLKLTEKVKQGGALLDIQLLDHLIITDEYYYSFADEGTL